jgi:DNA primase
LSELTDQTKKALQLLDVPFKRGNGYFQLSCPFASDPKSPHKNADRNPSFIIYEHRDLALCYGCGLRFKLFEFFETCAKFHDKKIDLKYIEFYVHIPDEEETDLENIPLIEDILNGYHKNSPFIKRYLKTRGINSDNIPFDLYYDAESRNVVSPIRDYNGDLFGATGRKTFKCQNQHHHYFGIITSKSVLGLERHDKSRGIIVEGLTDYLNAYDKITELGLDYNVYATLTCSMSEWQARALTLLSKPLYLCWDLDRATLTKDRTGRSKRDKALEKLSSVVWKYDVSWDFKNKDGSLKDIGDFTADDFSAIF